MVARFKLEPLPSRKRKDLFMNQSFQVQGMTCGHCERAVTQAITTLDPQATVAINRSAGQVDVDSSQPRQAIAAAIAEEGYTVAP
jgi:copper chaperone